VLAGQQAPAKPVRRVSLSATLIETRGALSRGGKLLSRWSDEMVVRIGDGAVLRSPIPAYLGNTEEK
jgi:hypothetical protein